MARRDRERVGVVVAVTAAAKTQKWPQLPYQTCPYIHKYIHRVYVHMPVCVCTYRRLYRDTGGFCFCPATKNGLAHTHTHTHNHARVKMPRQPNLVTESNNNNTQEDEESRKRRQHQQAKSTKRNEIK